MSTLRETLLSRLSRRTTTGRFIPEIDALRFISIACVVLFHLSAYLQVKAGVPAERVGKEGSLLAQALGTGHYGVQLFFIISGFVLALPLALQRIDGAPRVPLGAYFMRRLTRLEPPYILSMCAFFVLLLVRNHKSPAELLPSLGASLVYLHNVLYGAPSAINVVAWSLEVEVQFYVLAPLLCMVFSLRSKRLRRSLIGAVMIVAALLQLAYMEPDTRWSMSLLGHIQYFLAGLLLADLYVADWRQTPETALWWDVVSLVGWPLLVVVWLSRPATALVFPWLALALFCATFRGAWSRRVFRTPWIAVIGGMCYTIYLLHYAFIAAAGPFLSRFGQGQPFAVMFLVQACLLLPLLLLVSGLYFALIERPCMDKNWPQKLVAWVRAPRGALDP